MCEYLILPGVLWPNVANPNSGMRLAATGAIRETAMDYADAGYYTAEYLLQNYRDRLIERYSLAELPATQGELIDMIGAKRGLPEQTGHRRH